MFAHVQTVIYYAYDVLYVIPIMSIVQNDIALLLIIIIYSTEMSYLLKIRMVLILLYHIYYDLTGR